MLRNKIGSSCHIKHYNLLAQINLARARVWFYHFSLMNHNDASLIPNFELILMNLSINTAQTDMTVQSSRRGIKNFVLFCVTQTGYMKEYLNQK